MSSLNDLVASSNVASSAGNNGATGATANKIALDAALEAAGIQLGEFKTYIATNPPAPIEGTRIVKCLYQANKDGSKSKENAYCLLPTAHLTEEAIIARIKELAPYFVSYLADIEDSLAKEEHKKGGLRFYTDKLSIDALIEVLEARNTSGRLNKQDIEAWFDKEVSEPLAELFAPKLGIADINAAGIHELSKLMNILNAYKNKFASLAGGKAYIQADDRAAMIKVLDETGAASGGIGSRFKLRLQNMKDQTADILLAL